LRRTPPEGEMSNPDETMRPDGDSLDEGADSGLGLGSRIAARFAGVGLEFEILEWRGHVIEPMQFDEGDFSDAEGAEGAP